MDVGQVLAGRAPHAAQRRAVVQASPELQERERTKFAAVAGALAGALQERGAEAATAALADLPVHLTWRWCARLSTAPRSTP